MHGLSIRSGRGKREIVRYHTTSTDGWQAPVALLSRDSRGRMDPGVALVPFGRGTLLHAGEGLADDRQQPHQFAPVGVAQALEDLRVKSRLRGNKLLQQAQ